MDHLPKSTYAETHRKLYEILKDLNHINYGLSSQYIVLVIINEINYKISPCLEIEKHASK